MRIEAAYAPDIRAVARALRTCDVEKFMAILPSRSRDALTEDLAKRFANLGLMAFGPDRSAETIAIGGVIMQRPNVATTVFFATDRWGSIARPLSRWVRFNYFPALREDGVHRIETLTTLGHPDTDRWLAWLGMELEAVKPGFGIRGQTFVEYAWVADAYAPGTA